MPGGQAHVPLFIPYPTPDAAIGQVRVSRADDGAQLRFSILGQHRDETKRVQRADLHYERESEAGVETVDREWLLHWHTMGGFACLASDAGLKTLDILDGSGSAATSDATEFIFRLAR